MRFLVEPEYDKVGRRVEISATLSEAVADALHNAEDLPKEVSRVARRDIAGARFVADGDASRIVHGYRLAA